MAYQFKVESLLLNEYEVVKDIVEGNGEHITLYSSYVPRLVNRLERYFKMVDKSEDMLDNIVRVLDKYDLVYSQQVVIDTLEKSKEHDFKPLRQIDTDINIYKEEVEQINKLKNHGAKQLAFALLVVSKLRNVRFADPTIHLVNIIDVQRLCGKNRVKEDVYFLLHELVKEEMVTVPLIEDRLTINFTKYEGEVSYVLSNTDILNVSDVFNKVIGEYRDESQKCILEVSLVDTYYAVHSSLAEAVKVHNEQRSKNVAKSSVSGCINYNRASAGDSAFIMWDWDNREDEAFINDVCKFVRTTFQKEFHKS